MKYKAMVEWWLLVGKRQQRPGYKLQKIAIYYCPYIPVFLICKGVMATWWNFTGFLRFKPSKPE